MLAHTSHGQRAIVVQLAYQSTCHDMTGRRWVDRHMREQRFVRWRTQTALSSAQRFRQTIDTALLRNSHFPGWYWRFCASRLGLPFRRTLKRNCPLVSHVDVSRDPVISRKKLANHGRREARRFGTFRSEERIVRILLAQFAQQFFRQGVLFFLRRAAKTRI